MRKLRTFTARILKLKTNYKFARPYCADDIINIVVDKIYSGKYNFNNSYCTLITFFFIRIRTVIANIITHEKQFIPAKIKECDSDFIDFISDEITDDSVEYLTPEEFIVQPDFDEHEEDKNYIDPVEFTNIAFELFYDSPEEFCVLDEMYKGFKPRQIAEHLGLTVAQVYNIHQRIKRALITCYSTNAFLKVFKQDYV
jgi:DNA-directed RNA polymerase specialized sigma24 family protein